MSQTAKISGVRTQIYLPLSLYRRAKQHASARKVSLAAVVREAMEEKIGVNAEKTPPNDLLQYAGMIKDEASDVSQNMDKYLKEMYKQKFPWSSS